MQGPLAIADRRLLAALGARDGRASPAELRLATGLPPRTLSRALGRLEGDGLLAARSKGIVVLSARGWFLLEPPSQSATHARREERRREGTPVVFRAESRGGELASAVGALEPDPHFQDEEELDDEPDELAEEELAESRDEGALGRLWDGFRQGL